MTVATTSRFRQRLKIIVIAAFVLAQVERAVAATAPTNDTLVHHRDAKAALLGPDLDGNGVRDDLDDLAQQHFGNDERVAKAMRNFAITTQRLMITTTPQQSAKAHPGYRRAAGCVKGLAEIESSLKLDAIIEFAMMIADTGVRQDALREHFNRVVAMKLDLQEMPQFDAACLETPGIADLRQPADE